MKNRTLTPPDDYRLSQSVDYLTDFTPQPVEPSAVQLRFATSLSPSWTPTMIVVTQPGADLAIEWSGDVHADVVVGHVSRILSIDVDGSGFAGVLERDPVIAGLIDVERGFRPPLFWSPYEAAVWAVLSQRIRMTQATKLKTDLAAALGSTDLDDGLSTTPGPAVLAELDDFPGLPDVKVERLRAVGRAALDGLLDPDRLREQPIEDAIDALRTIDGIGPFSAELIAVRGAGAPDVFPSNEKRLHAAMRQRYQMPNASPTDLAAVAANWAPYRSWVSFQLRAAAQRE